MKFLIVLITLILFKYFQLGKSFSRFQWIDNYIEDLQIWTKKIRKENIYIKLLILLAPIVGSLIFLYFIFHFVGLDFLKFFLTFFIIIYCIDPDNILLRKENDILEEVGQEKEKKNILSYAALQAYFSPLFWFILLGPLVALVYRLLERFSISKKLEQQIEPVHKNQLDMLLNFFDWLPARVMAIGFCLAGHFIPCFDYIRKNFNILSVKIFITQAAKAASDQIENITEADENSLLLKLIVRTFILFLIIFALIIIKDAF